MKKIVGVIGGRQCNKKVEQISINLGKKLAKVADILVSGGLSGVMKAISKGIVNMVDNAYTTTEIITDWVDIAKACN